MLVAGGAARDRGDAQGRGRSGMVQEGSRDSLEPANSWPPVGPRAVRWGGSGDGRRMPAVTAGMASDEPSVSWRKSR